MSKKVEKAGKEPTLADIIKDDIPFGQKIYEAMHIFNERYGAMTTLIFDFLFIMFKNGTPNHPIGITEIMKGDSEDPRIIMITEALTEYISRHDNIVHEDIPKFISLYLELLGMSDMEIVTDKEVTIHTSTSSDKKTNHNESKQSSASEMKALKDQIKRLNLRVAKLESKSNNHFGAIDKILSMYRGLKRRVSSLRFDVRQNKHNYLNLSHQMKYTMDNLKLDFDSVKCSEVVLHENDSDDEDTVVESEEDEDEDEDEKEPSEIFFEKVEEVEKVIGEELAASLKKKAFDQALAESQTTEYLLLNQKQLEAKIDFHYHERFNRVKFLTEDKLVFEAHLGMAIISQAQKRIRELNNVDTKASR